MQIIKFLLGLFCLILTYRAFKNGLEPGEGFFFYIPIIIVFIIGVLLIKSVLSSFVKKNDYEK